MKVDAFLKTFQNLQNYYFDIRTIGGWLLLNLCMTTAE